MKKKSETVKTVAPKAKNYSHSGTLESSSSFESKVIKNSSVQRLFIELLSAYSWVQVYVQRSRE